MATKKKTESKKEEKIIATVTGGDLNIRPTHSTSEPPIGVLKDGQEVEILTVGKEWCKIEGGYVMKKFLTF